jgi:hypothetical protein
MHQPIHPILGLLYHQHKLTSGILEISLTTLGSILHKNRPRFDSHLLLYVRFGGPSIKFLRHHFFQFFQYGVIPVSFFGRIERGFTPDSFSFYIRKKWGRDMPITAIRLPR